MGKIGGLGLLVIGIFLLFLGLLIYAGIFDWLLDVAGILLIVGGIIAGIIGLVKMLRGGGSDQF